MPNVYVENDDIERAVQEIAQDANKDGFADTLTYRDIRRKVERKLDLESGDLDHPDYKDLVKTMFKRATDDYDFDGIPSSPARLAPTKTKKADIESKKRKQPVFKSPEFVPTSESENEDENSNKPGLSQQKKSPNRLKQTPKLNAPKTANNVEDDDEEDSDTPALEPKPKKRRLSKENEGKKATKEKKPTKKASAPTDKDEERVKKLKSLVLACGVRKAWAKLFQDAPKPSQQIAILKKILTELGMTGRMSMEQAKAIREKRELAQELEDVQSFEKSIIRQSARRGSSSKPKPRPVSDAEDDAQTSEDEEPVVVSKRKTARQQIAAFLADDDSD